MKKAFTTGTIVMLLWCALMLVAGETLAAGVSWVLGLWCWYRAGMFMEETDDAQ